MTVTECRDGVVECGAILDYYPVAWFGDPEGLRDIEDPSDAEGLLGALAECHRLRGGLYIPYGVDVPQEQHRRLIGHWLYRHGLSLYLAFERLDWHDVNDVFDRALRRQLDMASDLELAVAASAALPSLDRLVGELVGDHPIDAEEISGLPTSRAPAIASVEAPVMSGDRIGVVIVNDEPDIRSLVGLRCEEDGRFKVVGEAATGREALGLLHEGGPDVILLDTFMPDLTGMDVLPEIRARCPGTRIIIYAPPYDDWFSMALTLGANAAVDCSRASLDHLMNLMATLCAHG